MPALSRLFSSTGLLFCKACLKLLICTETGLSSGIQQFILTTFGFFSRETHVLTAVFVYGREAVTTTLFPPLVEQLKQSMPEPLTSSLEPLRYYLNRHIQLDGENHFPHALQILRNLVDHHRKKWVDIFVRAEFALQARLNFLTAIQRKIRAVK